VQGLVGYAYNDNAMERTISFPGINSTANGSTYSNQFLGAVEGGYEIPIAKASSVTPFLGIQSTFANQASFTETGAGTLNLNVDGQTTTSVRSILGFQLDHDLNLGFASPIALLARAGWAHEYADTARPMTASFAGAPGAGFTVDGAQIARDSAVLALGATAKLTQNLSFLLRYDADLNGSDNANAITGKLSYSW
jgi:fibronectin-binding autotransporter adhesin